MLARLALEFARPHTDSTGGRVREPQAELRTVPDAWVETAGEHIVARHDERDTRDALTLLGELEVLCARTSALLQIASPAELAVVLHGTPLQLDLAQPLLPALRAVTQGPVRRFVVGTAQSGTVHVLAPRVLRDRTTHDGPDEQEYLRLAPAALVVQALVGLASPRLRSRRVLLRPGWAWLAWGAGQVLSGQTEHARGLVRRRLRARGQPAFPPGLADAPLLGGTVLDLLRREEGDDAVAALARTPPRGAPEEALRHAFRGRSALHSAGAWRAYLARFAEAAER